MKWSKLKQLTEARFVKSLKGRVEIFSTAYGNCSCGRAWITLDGNTIAIFCTRSYWNHKRVMARQELGIDKENREKCYPEQYVKPGEFSRQGFYRSCWSFIHKLKIEEALSSNDLITQCLALIDERLGRRRLLRVDKNNLHPLAKILYETRVLTLL